MTDRWEDLSDEQRTAWLRGAKLYEVLDSYGIPVFTGTLNECGVWIDPVLGIDFEGAMWGNDHVVDTIVTSESEVDVLGGIDDDRFEIQEDGTIVVQMYQGPGGIGGEMTIRPKEDA